MRFAIRRRRRPCGGGSRRRWEPGFHLQERAELTGTAAIRFAQDLLPILEASEEVMVRRLVSANTIEDKVMALKARKAQLFDAVLSDDEGSFSGSLGPDDIRGLFEAS
jgi:hypothetical protein